MSNNVKTNFFKYLVNIICKTVDINKSCVLSIVRLSFNKLKLILDNVVSKKLFYQMLTNYVNHEIYKIHSLEYL